MLSEVQLPNLAVFQVGAGWGHIFPVKMTWGRAIKPGALSLLPVAYAIGPVTELCSPSSVMEMMMSFFLLEDWNLQVASGRWAALSKPVSL